MSAMTTIWPLPHIEIQEIGAIQESRPAALLAGQTAWEKYGKYLRLPLVIQAEPLHADLDYLKDLSVGLPPEVEVIYALGGGLVADAAKYIGWANKKPVVVVPTALSVDGFFTSIAAIREDGSVKYETTGPAEQVVIDWEVIRNAPAHIRGTGICELLSIVTGLLDWQYAHDRNKTTPETRYIAWAAKLAAGLAQQAFIIAKGVGQGKIESLKTLLDLMAVEVQLTNQLGHNRPQEGSEQIFAYAAEKKVYRERYRIPYADLIGPGILIAGALHGQNVSQIRDTIEAAGIRLDQLRSQTIFETLQEMPEFVRRHEVDYTIFNDVDLSAEKINAVLAQTGLDKRTV